MPLFDTYVAVDWSAQAKPATGADSIWIAVLDRGGDVALSNPSTRLTAERELRAVVDATSDRRVLIGIDVGLGYPSGTAALLDLVVAGQPEWRSTWAALAAASVDDERNANNRFEVAGMLNGRSGATEGPFWGCPHGRVVEGLAATKPGALSLGVYRATERALRAAGRSPMSMWQLTGAGSVGSQSLTAIPVLHRLLGDLQQRVAVWPYTTGLVAPVVDPGGVVVAEVWPTTFDPPYPAGTIRDAAQVAHVARRCGDADASGALADWFTPIVEDERAVVDEEGWVLGPQSV